MLINRSLLDKYPTAGPRYTSYPTAADFENNFDSRLLEKELLAGNASKSPLSIYLHVPFCESLCFYCGCNKVVTRNHHRADEYLAYLFREIEHYGSLICASRQIEQLHIGGGTPTFLSVDQLSALMKQLKKHFSFVDDRHGDFSIEIDPRQVDVEVINHLRFLGFNRLSLGVQDFDARVQSAINRIQPYEQTFSAINAANDAGFTSINVDLIYGLPHQTAKSFKSTIRRIIELKPDRISLFSYAHIPHIIKAQRAIDDGAIPNTDEKLAIFELSKKMFEQAGYISIGLDHFAKPGDPLSIAANEQQLQRNFQGYTTHKDMPLLGLGVSSISKVGRVFAQNSKELPDYYQAINTRNNAINRGRYLTQDDEIRANVISDLSCDRAVVFSEYNARYSITFSDYFLNELMMLKSFIDDGLVIHSDNAIVVSDFGRMLLRPICMVFDIYRQSDDTLKFSKVV